MIFIVLRSYKPKDLFLLIYDTIEQLFRMTIGRLFGLRPMIIIINLLITENIMERIF